MSGGAFCPTRMGLHLPSLLASSPTTGRLGWQTLWAVPPGGMPWDTEPMQSGRRQPEKGNKQGRHTCQGPAKGIAKLGHLRGSSAGRPTAILHPPHRVHTREYKQRRGSEQTGSSEVLQAERELPERRISQALNRLMSWGFINPASCDCCRCPHQRGAHSEIILGSWGIHRSPRSWPQIQGAHTRCQVP